MRTLVISNASRSLLDGHIVGRAVAVQRQLADKSWEVEVDDDMAFALDQLSFDPDVAFSMICTDGWVTCYRCGKSGLPIDDGETCRFCKLVW